MAFWHLPSPLASGLAGLGGAAWADQAGPLAWAHWACVRCRWDQRPWPSGPGNSGPGPSGPGPAAVGLGPGSVSLGPLGLATLGPGAVGLGPAGPVLTTYPLPHKTSIRLSIRLPIRLSIRLSIRQSKNNRKSLFLGGATGSQIIKFQQILFLTRLRASAETLVIVL